MPQSYKGTIHIDIGELEALVQQLKQLKDTLDVQRRHFSTLQVGLDHAISGTAVNISAFDDRFDFWMKSLYSLVENMDTTYYTLKAALEEAHEHDIAGALEALKNGSKGKSA